MDSLLQAASRDPTIAPPRKILCIAALATAVLFAVPGAAGAAKPQRLIRAGLSQAGRELIFPPRTGSPGPPAKLEPRPDPKRAAPPYPLLARSPARGKRERPT